MWYASASVQLKMKLRVICPWILTENIESRANVPKSLSTF